jgi:hypothetical protein
MIELRPPLAAEVLPASAQAIHARVVHHRAAAEAELLQMGNWLRLMHDQQLYLDLGYPTWRAYLAAPDVNLSKTHAQRHMDVARVYLEQAVRPLDGAPVVPAAALAAIGVTKASLIAPLVVERPDEAEEWLARAETLTVRDLEVSVRTERGRGPTQVQEAQEDLARKLRAITHHLEHTHDPLGVLDELLGAAQEGRAYLALIVPAVPTSTHDAR